MKTPRKLLKNHSRRWSSSQEVETREDKQQEYEQIMLSTHICWRTVIYKYEYLCKHSYVILLPVNDTI